MSETLLVTGASGMLGTAVTKALSTAPPGCRILAPSHAQLDLLDERAVGDWFAAHRPTQVLHLAGHVRGLAENMSRQVDALALNARMGLNLLGACATFPPSKLVIAGSTAAYGFPYARLPLREEDLFTGDAHPGEHGYASAHRLLIAGARVLHADAGVDVRVALLTNMFGPGDRFGASAAHVVPALIARFCEAAERGDDEVVVWGKPDTTRDFMFVDDAADAMVAIARAETCPAMINVASGTERTMAEVVHEIREATGFRGAVSWDADKPIGIPRRSVDVSLLAELDLPAAIGFEEGIRRTVVWYRAQF